MLAYYFELALRSLRRNLVLTALMIAAVGVGIGASMTMLTTLRAMSGDPIPDKSSKLFVPQIDVWGPQTRRPGTPGGDRLPEAFTYRDATALMKAHRGVRQAVMYAVAMDVDPGSGRPFQAIGRATYTDFFSLFEVPLASGAPWSSADDDAHANVVVLSASLAGRVFPNAPPVGRTITLDGRDYRVVGVLKPWAPIPRFYDVQGGFADTEDFFLPFGNAIDHQLDTYENLNCTALPPAGWDGLLNSECIWLQFWVELPTAAAVRDYRTFLNNYSADQRQAGRFHWPPQVELHDVSDWLVHENVVPEQVRVNTLIGLGFLVVCLINAIGLMLARFGSRTGELGIRRALGGSRTDVFLQCLVETAVIGLAGGLLGLGLTAGGLALNRMLRERGAPNASLEALTRLDGGMLAIILTVAVVATLCAGLYPAWRASRVQPGWQLKAQ